MMKARYFLLAALLFGTGFAQAQDMIIGTYNLRYANPNDTGNLWQYREPVIVSLIKFHDFDIFGTQEGLIDPVKQLSTDLPEYERYGIGRDDGKDAGEHSEIFFKKDKFKMLDHGDFWLSETPDKPSLGWDATCCNRICSWVYLEDLKSKKKFYFFNAHYDYQKDLARNESSKLILKKIKEIAGNKPVIFTGDLNGDNNSEWYKYIANSNILNDTYKEAKDPYVNNGSFNGFGKTIDSNNIIDHVFASKDFTVKKWGILTDTYHGKYPSDHFPILAEVVLH